MGKDKTSQSATAFSSQPKFGSIKIILMGLLLSAAACAERDVEPSPLLPDAESKALADKSIINVAQDADVSVSILRDALRPFFERNDLSETRAVVIMHKGSVVAERYAPGYSENTPLISWSMAKTLTATLVGLMVADGRLVLDDRAPVAAWSSPADPRNKITLRHLLHMASGLDHSEGAAPDQGKALYESDTTRMLFLDGRDNVAQYAQARQLEAQPGEKFEYSSATTNILADIMTNILTDSKDPVARRDAMLTFAKGRLFDPLGMTTMVPEFDRNGTMLGGSMVHGSARDWAKLGEFLRNNGSVKGAQLLPTSWTRFMRTSSPTDPAYGGQTWINKQRPEGRNVVLFGGRGADNIFGMLGHLGQSVISSPNHKLTIVRMGKTLDGQTRPIYDHIANVISKFPETKR